MFAKWTAVIVLMLACSSAFAADVPVAPPPHQPSAIRIAAVKGGYTISLNRETAELFRDTLANTDEKELAATLRKFAKDKRAADPDDKSAATLELVAFVVANQLAGFKKSFAENIGPGGATITMMGLQAPVVPAPEGRPVLGKAIATARAVMPLLPDDAKDVMEALRAIGRTTPLFWKVEPRE